MPSVARMRVPVTVISSSAASAGVWAALPPASSSAMAPANELEPMRETKACCGFFMAQLPPKLSLAPAERPIGMEHSVLFVIADSVNTSNHLRYEQAAAAPGRCDML